MKTSSIVLYAGLALAAPAFGQTINIKTTTAPLDAVSISDVDFVNSTTPKWLFTIDLSVTPPGQSVDAVMDITLDIALASGEQLTGIAHLQSQQFTIKGSRVFTNLDFRNPSLRALYSVDESKKQRLLDLARPSGIMPSGTYAFHVTVEPRGAAGPPAQDAFAFVLTNPSNIELLLPADGDAAVSPFPLFQWQFDGTRSTLFLFEQLPGQVSSEETASGIPLLSADVTTTSYRYPTSGVRALLPGKTYVWYVEGHIRTSGGTDVALKSPLRSFTVALGSGTPTATLLDQLEAVLPLKYKPVFDRIRAEGLTQTGTIRLNNDAITQPDLMNLINMFRTNPDAVLSVELE